MVRRLTWISGLLAASLLTSLAYATPLERVLLVSSSARWDIYEIVFDEDVDLLGEVQRRDDRLIVQIRTHVSGRPSFESETLDYEGTLGPIIDVTVAGYAAQALTVTIAMTSAAGAELMPQADPRRITFRLPSASQAAEATDAETAVQAIAAQVAPVVDGSIADDGIALPGAVDGPVHTTDPDAAEALEQGRAAAANGEYANAIAAFTKAMNTPDTTTRQNAMELLGVAREYNNQKAHAKAVWDQYLQEYPDSPDAPRVRQRIAGLITRDLPSQAKLKPQQTQSPWRVVGTASQFYRRQAFNIDGQQEIVGIDSIFSDADLIVDRRGENVDFGARYAGGYIYDMTGDLADGRIFATSYAFLEADMHSIDVNVRVGRQSRTSSGILGRFDGMLLGWSPATWLNVGVVGGYAVDSSFDGIHTDRPFYGVSVEATSADGKLGFAPFLIEQQIDGFTDRRAVGMEAHYYRDNGTLFSLVDYDIYHEELNNVYLFGNYVVPSDMQLYASFDYRRSPYISTQNALIGQPFDDLSQLEREFANREILDLANDRTAEVSFISVGGDKDLSERYQIGFDVGYSDFSETPSSGDVAGYPAREDLYYTLRFRANELFGAGSYSSIYLRYVDSEDSSTRSAYLANRFRIGQSWYLYTRMRGDFREFQSSDQEQWIVAPSIRLDYRWNQRATLEVETGYEWTTRTMPNDQFKMNGYFIRGGYRWLF